MEAWQEVMLGRDVWSDPENDKSVPDIAEDSSIETEITKALGGGGATSDLGKRAASGPITYSIEKVDGIRMRIGRDETGGEVSCFILDDDADGDE